MTKRITSKLAVVDFETDPFKYGRDPEPFAAGFYDGDEYCYFWGDDCAEQLIHHIKSIKTKLIIYAHNGGKFDFFYFLKLGVVQNPILIINGRIVKASIGIHEIRDSFAIMPAALKIMGDGDNDKLDIDYEKMERTVRELNKTEILKYLKMDCVVLFNAVRKFWDRYGPKLTVGSMAISELGKLHKVSRQNKGHDTKFRPYYFGGRVQCFESGIVDCDLELVDANAMYPSVMANFTHPTGAFYISKKDCGNLINNKTGLIKGFENSKVYFCKILAYSVGCLPRKNDKGILEFPIGEFEFFACSHEIIAGCELGLLKVKKIYDLYVPCEKIVFDKFVELCIQEKYHYQKVGDLVEVLLTKFKMNSAYGKYGSNPENFKEWYIYDEECHPEDHDKFEMWRSKCPKIFDDSGKIVSRGTELIQDFGRFEIWAQPSPNDDGYFDVAVAASICSAARSVLFRAITGSERPVYCDTDSLLCKKFKGGEVHPTKLGAWKVEGTTSRAYIAGKKLYSMKLNERDKKGNIKYKLASKGAHLVHDDIVKICNGETVIWQSDAPNFKMSGEVKYVARRIKSLIINH